MFVIILTYKKSLETVEQQIPGHRQFLDECYKNNFFVASGVKIPRDGGVIISHLKDRTQLETILARDPFYSHDLAHYEIIEFEPSKFHPNFSSFV